MRYLTTDERDNLAAWTARHRPELIGYRDRTRVVTMPTPTYTAYDLDAMQHHMQELSTMGIGPSLEEQRRARERAYREAVALVIIGVMATFGALLVIWAFASIVRTAIG